VNCIEVERLQIAVSEASSGAKRFDNAEMPA
jgi:hypothetical protein